MESRKDESVGADGTEQPPLSSLVGLERKCKFQDIIAEGSLLPSDKERQIR